nr:unnamed protein product [Spirometra erinaceieuropaei]
MTVNKQLDKGETSSKHYFPTLKGTRVEHNHSPKRLHYAQTPRRLLTRDWTNVTRRPLRRSLITLLAHVHLI